MENQEIVDMSFSFPSVLPSTPCFSCTQATRDGSIQSRWSWNGQLNLLLAQLSDDGMISTHEGILVDQLCSWKQCQLAASRLENWNHDNDTDDTSINTI